MTRQRQMMLEELQRRNYSPGTIRCYLSAVADFARYFHRPPDQLRPPHICEYQAYLFRERKLDASSVTQNLAALRFFFIKTLRKPWSMAETPYPKQVRRLPTVLSQEEVARQINSARNPFDQVLLMTLYATGARCAEVARLQVGDIDSQRMVVHIRGSKGREDRDVMLSPVLLEALRQHWSQLKPKEAFPCRPSAYRHPTPQHRDRLARLPLYGSACGPQQIRACAHASPLFCGSVKPGAPGSYQSGGPSGNVIPIWKAGAPALDMVSPDHYAPKTAGLATRCKKVEFETDLRETALISAIGCKVFSRQDGQDGSSGLGVRRQEVSA